MVNESGEFVNMVLRQIIDWTNKELDAWKREAVKLFLTQDSIDDNDENCLFQMLRKTYGLPCDGEFTAIDNLLKPEEITGIEEHGKKIVLRQIKDIKGVNALPSGSSISFAHTGITVVYGENGTGKSGYARILKKSCFARDDKERVHGNIFSTTPLVTPEAVFKLDIDGDEILCKWVDTKSKPEILGAICVFDNKSARVIVDEKNSISYLPYGADVFQKLVAIIQKFKTKLDQEKPTPFKPDIPYLPETTKSGAFFASLNAQTKAEDLKLWCQWKEGKDENSDELKLTGLNTKYVLAKNGDTTKQIQSLQNLKSRLNAFQEQISQIASLFSSESVKNFNPLVGLRDNLRKAYKISTKKPEGPLPGIASTEWEALYWAAKEYSTKQAYPGDKFPATDDSQKCVLCMQDLSQEANQRFSNFYQYMESAVKQELDDTSTKLAEIVSSLDALDCVKIITNFKDVLDEISNRNNDVAQKIKGYLDNASELQKIYLKAEKENKTCIAKDLEFNFKQFEIIEKLIVSEIEEHKKNSDPNELKKLEIELGELKARKQLAINSEKINSYLSDLIKVELYDIVINSLETRSITQKGKDLIGQALTPRLTNALSDELKSLGISHIPLNLKHSGSAGENVHQMRIQTQKGISKVKLSEVLSEGEQRVIAIAGFLAELNLQENPMPIVFDDPISSLDHKYSVKIAARLVEESKNRQVIIFTHDISFMLELQHKSEENGLYCHCVSVHRDGNVAGKIRDGVAWHAMKVNQRLHFIDNKLTEISPLFPDRPQKYNSEIAVLYSYLRETWEAAIEEALFNNTVRRFSAEVQTLRLKGVVVEGTDYNVISKGMSRCSKWMIGHDLSKVISENRPSPVEFQNDIKELRDFTNSLRTRRKATVEMKKIAVPKIG